MLARVARAICALIPLLTLCAACGEIPKDPEMTLERVQSTRLMRVGLVATNGERRRGEQLFLSRVASNTHSVPVVQVGPAEELLSKLEKGRLDLVVGEFHSSSPWAPRVTFVPLLTQQARDGERMLLGSAARNGENAWIALLHKHSNAFGGEQ